MRKIREVLRLKFGLGLRDRAIARSCSIPRSSVANYVYRASQAGLSTWPLVPDLDDEALEQLLFPPGIVKVDPQKSVTPDFAWMHEELRRHKHVTLQLLWDEYKQSDPDGYQYSQFCELYRSWARKIDVVLRPEVGHPLRWEVGHFGGHSGMDGQHGPEYAQRTLWMAPISILFEEFTASIAEEPAQIVLRVRVHEIYGGWRGGGEKDQRTAPWPRDRPYGLEISLRAQQFRHLLTSAPHILMQGIRRLTAGTKL